MAILTIAEVDRLELGDGQTLFVNTLVNNGAITGAGTLRTVCENLVNSGAIAATIVIICFAGGYLIDEFAKMEPVYLNDEKLLDLAIVANSVPAARRGYQN